MPDVFEGIAELDGDLLRGNSDVDLVLSPSTGPSPDIAIEPGAQVAKEVVAQKIFELQ